MSHEELERRIAQLEAENAILDKMSDGIVAVGADLQVLRYNKCFAEMWDLPLFGNEEYLNLENLKSKMIEHIEAEPDEIDEILERLLSCDVEKADLLDVELKDEEMVEQTFARENDTGTLEAYVWSYHYVTRQRTIRNELGRKEQFLKRLLHNAPLILFSVAMDGTIEFMEGRSRAFFGTYKYGLLGKNVFDIVTEEIKTELQKALAGNLVQLYDMTNPDDEIYWNMTYSPLLNEGGEQIGVIGIVQDVTELHDAEQKRKQQQQLFNRIIYNAPVLLVATDIKGIITFSRGKLLKRYEMRQGQNEGKNFFELYEGHAICSDAHAAIEGKTIRKTHDFTMLPLGGYSEITCSSLRDEDGQIIGMVAVEVDVTEQTEAQMEINRQRQYLERILSNAPIVIFATDRSGTLTFARGAELQQLGIAQNELIGGRIFLGSEKHPIQGDIRRALNGETIHQLHQFGDLHFDIYCTPLLDQDANINGMIGVGVNVTDSKRAEEAIEESQAFRAAKEAAEAANIAKTTFISNMSHELRTPLNSIIGFAQLLENDQGLSREQQEYLSLITRSGEHLLSLINDILEISKIETGKIDLNTSNFDLYQLLEDMDSIYHTKASEQNLNFDLKIDNSVPRYLHGDRNKLRQILINLLSNAIKYTHKGEVTLRTWLDESEFADQQNPYHLYFSVEDTGLGIAPYELDLLFDPFTQTESGQQSAGGTGLGLVITRKFAQLMGGDVAVQSAKGEGSHFVVDVYVESASVIPEPEDWNIRRVVGIAKDRQCKLLVVDDKWENRLMLYRTLEAVGFEVREAGNGYEAINVWREWKPDLILMDMRMPIMNGYDATRKIREQENGTDVVIVALTAKAFESERREVLAAGCDDYVAKPFRQQALFEKVKSHLDIEYIYEEQDIDALDLLDNTQLSLSTSLMLIDEELQHNLRKAAERYSLTDVLAVTEKIALQDKMLAEQIAQLARNFDFGRILHGLYS